MEYFLFPKKKEKTRAAQKIVDKWGESNGHPEWRCCSCEWWDNSPWQIEPETRLCLYPEKRANAKSWGFVEACGPEFGCVHWSEK